MCSRRYKWFLHSFKWFHQCAWSDICLFTMPSPPIAYPPGEYVHIYFPCNNSKQNEHSFGEHKHQLWEREKERENERKRVQRVKPVSTCRWQWDWAAHCWLSRQPGRSDAAWPVWRSPGTEPEPPVWTAASYGHTRSSPPPSEAPCRTAITVFTLTCSQGLPVKNTLIQSPSTYGYTICQRQLPGRNMSIEWKYWSYLLFIFQWKWIS